MHMWQAKGTQRIARGIDIEVITPTTYPVTYKESAYEVVLSQQFSSSSRPEEEVFTAVWMLSNKPKILPASSWILLAAL